MACDMCDINIYIKKTEQNCDGSYENSHFLLGKNVLISLYKFEIHTLMMKLLV